MAVLVTQVDPSKLAHIKKGMQTPWGAAQHITVIANGIEFVSTAGHGGFHLDLEHRTKMLARFPQFQPFTRTWEWLEEDCDAALVPIVFPQHFDADAVARAKQMVTAMREYYASCHDRLES